MKKLIQFAIPLLFVALLSSCTVQIPHIPSIKYTESVDYSRFPGFFITESNSVRFEYKPIASVTTTHIQGVEGKVLSIWTMQEIEEVNEETKKSKFKDDVYGSNDKKSPIAEKKKVEIVTLEGHWKI